MNELHVPQKYIGIPFTDNGDSFAGANCLHVAKLYVENELGVKVTQLPPDIDKAQEQEEKYRSLLEPIPFNELIPGDVPFFCLNGSWHCGVYTGYGKMLHTMRPLSPSQKSYSLKSRIPFHWRSRYIGAIRTKGKTEIIVPDAGAVVAIICSIISLVIGIGSMIYSFVAGSKAKKLNFGNDTGSSYLGFDALANTVSNEVIYPLGFGTCKYAGNVIWYKNEGNITKRLIIVGIGPINSISDVRVNDIPIGDLPGCSYTSYLGTPGQSVDSRCAGEVKGLRNVAYIALTLETSDQLPGGDPTVTYVAEWLLTKTWNGSTWTGETFSRNPAACVRKLLTILKEDGGPEVAESELDDEAFGEVYDYWAELVSDGAGGTHARGQFDFVFDAEKPICDALAEIMQAYGMYFIIGEKISLHVLKTEDTTSNYGMDDIEAGSFKYYESSKEDRYNLVYVKYRDPDQNDVGVDVPAVDKYDQISTGQVRTGEFDFQCISRYPEASRRAEFIKNDTLINKTLCEFTLSIAALHNTIGDVITVTHDLPAWTQKPFRIIKITEELDHRRKVVAREYNASIYNDALGSVIETYDYGSPPNAYAPVDDVTGLAITESQYYVHKNGQIGSDILVSWTAPAGVSKKFLREYQIELKKGAADYRTVGFTFDTNFIIYAVEDEVTYKVRIKTISFNDVVSNGIISNDLTILGKLQPPSNVTGFDIYQEGNMLHAKWDPLSPIYDPDLARYEVRKGSEWSTGTFVGERLDTTEFMFPVGEIGQQTFMVKAFDTSGNESTAPAIDVITVIPPPDMNFVNIFDRWNFPLDYILSNLELVQINYHDTDFVRPCLALKTVITWEEREAEAKTWEQQEADGGLLLDGDVEATGYAEMAYPYDLGTIFEFKLIIDADYKNATGGTLAIHVSTSEDGTNYSAFAEININTTYRARYLKFKIIISTSDIAYNLYLYDLSIFINAPQVRKSWGQDIGIPIAGKDLIFDAGFSRAPRLMAIVSNGIAGYPSWAKTDLTKDSVKMYVKDFTGSAIGTAEINFEASGT